MGKFFVFSIGLLNIKKKVFEGNIVISLINMHTWGVNTALHKQLITFSTLDAIDLVRSREVAMLFFWRNLYYCVYL
jgi:hypothetical protein